MGRKRFRLNDHKCQKSEIILGETCSGAKTTQQVLLCYVLGDWGRPRGLAIQHGVVDNELGGHYRFRSSS